MDPECPTHREPVAAYAGLGLAEDDVNLVNHYLRTTLLALRVGGADGSGASGSTLAGKGERQP